MLADIVDGTFLGCSHPMLDLGEGLLDRIEVWVVLHQILHSTEQDFQKEIRS
jgi:hypothetical protein